MSTLSQFFGSSSSGGGKWKSQTFLSSGTFVAPAGVEVVRVLLVGGGGGGYNDVDGGGGGGGEIVDRFVPVTPGTSYSITIGPGGAPASNGTNSTFGTNLLTARGGYSPGAVESNDGGNGGGVNSLFSANNGSSFIAVSHGGVFNTSSSLNAGSIGISSGASVSGGGGGSASASARRNGGNVIGYGSGGLGNTNGAGGGASYGNGADGGASAAANSGGGGGSNGSGGSGICIVYWVE